jgi:RNA polymerase sigma-70 factor (ECF subfamily)
LLNSDLKAELERLHEASFGWALHCCRRNHAQAEEVLQTVYLKILQGKACYRGESSVKTWLFAVIRKTASSERRRHLLHALKAIAGINSETRERESLDVELDLSLSEAAEVMNVSVGTARQHYERGKKRLREALDREGIDYGFGWRRKENSGAVL